MYISYLYIFSHDNDGIFSSFLRRLTTGQKLKFPDPANENYNDEVILKTKLQSAENDISLASETGEIYDKLRIQRRTRNS
jgi:hypothetical protein